MLALTSVWTTVLLAAAVALGPLATDMYLPALPTMGSELGADSARIQLTLSLYMAGFALAQLFCGPLSDRFGRKPVMIGGLGLFFLASLGCALAPNVESLMVCRFLQALGGSAGPVLGRASVRDIYTPRDAARIIAILASIMSVAPAVAPTLGGLLLEFVGWQSIFVALAGYGLLMMLVVSVAMPEPMKPEHQQSLRLGNLIRNYRRIALDPSFIGYTLTNALAFSGIFAFLSGASFVLIDFLGVPNGQFGLYFAVMVVGYVLGNLLAAYLGNHLLPDQTLLYGLLISTLGGILMMSLSLLEVHNVWAVVIPQAIFMAGAGLTLPQTMAGALASFPAMAGSASALFGFVQMAVAACIGVLVGHLYGGTALAMASIIAACSVAALGAYLVLVQRYPAPGFEACAVGD